VNFLRVLFAPAGQKWFWRKWAWWFILFVTEDIIIILSFLHLL
jgi:hypothetical protein